MVGSHEDCSIADQAAGCDVFLQNVNRWNPVARGQRDDLLASAVEEEVADDERVNMLTESGKDGVDLAFLAGRKPLTPAAGCVDAMSGSIAGFIR